MQVSTHPLLISHAEQQSSLNMLGWEVLQRAGESGWLTSSTTWSCSTTKHGPWTERGPQVGPVLTLLTFHLSWLLPWGEPVGTGNAAVCSLRAVKFGTLIVTGPGLGSGKFP